MAQTENSLRKEQIKKALIRAYEETAAEHWFEAMSSIQEAELITRVLLEQFRRSTYKSEDSHG